ncbi:MAG: hypothetical protein ACLPY5_05445 [Candidatus Bathyarchaeia archaeon]
MSTVMIDPTLTVLAIGSAILYYGRIYEMMQNNKRKSGSYWKS